MTIHLHGLLGSAPPPSSGSATTPACASTTPAALPHRTGGLVGVDFTVTSTHPDQEVIR